MALKMDPPNVTSSGQQKGLEKHRIGFHRMVWHKYNLETSIPLDPRVSGGAQRGTAYSGGSHMLLSESIRWCGMRMLA